MFQHIVMYTAWRIDRGCSRMLEDAKPDLIQQPSTRLLYHRASVAQSSKRRPPTTEVTGSSPVSYI